MSTNESKPPLNLNTIFLAILVALSGWTLNKVSVLGEQMSVVTERHSTYSRELLELRARVATIELRIQEIRLEIANKRD